VAVASLEGGRRPLLFVSALAAHTPQLRADPRCSLLVGDMGKGDPLANPRVTLQCRAREILRGGAEHRALREVWLAAHPKAKVYVDLADFVFMELDVAAVSFVGGFGRAYAIGREAWMVG
jgi:putative heme iron utilization protein